MNNRTGGQDSFSPPVDNDPQATRYFPPQTEPSQLGSYPNAPATPAPAQSDPVAPEQGGYTLQAERAPYAQPVTPAPVRHWQHSHGRHPKGGAWAGRSERDRTLLAMLLIGGGVLFLFDQLNLFGGFGNLILLLIGGVFMYAYFTTKQSYRVGFLIPGAILSGLGAGVLLEDTPLVQMLGGNDITTVTLGLGFCLIWLLERKHWWSLIPGGILVLTGLSSFRVIGSLWPLALIAVGVYMLVDQSRRKTPR